MLTVKIVSGLGNQLFQYALGRKLVFDKKTTLKLDASFFATQKLRKFKLENYNIRADVCFNYDTRKFHLPLSNSKYFNILLGYLLFKNPALYSRYLAINNYYKEQDWWIYQPKLIEEIRGSLKKETPIYLDGYWQHYKYFENLNKSILEELTLKEPHGKIVEKLLCEIKKNNSVSIHFRRGDYLSDRETNTLFGVLPLEYYLDAISWINDRVEDPVFYVFSDDIEWCKKSLNFIKSINFVEGNDDYIDLDIMSKCKHNIIANSSFSWWGAFLNRNPDKIVVGPENWVIESDLNKKVNILFPTWVKV